jgi:serine phosphatase RsbU (regulator of sigma subunit)
LMNVRRVVTRLKIGSSWIPAWVRPAVLVLTDGFTEAADPAGELYGEDRIATFMQQADPGDPGLLSTLVRQVRDFEGGMPPSDDMAAILLSLREGATG